MTILVTGGCGYLGDQLVLALRDANRDVVVLDRSADRFPSPRDGVRYISQEVGDEVALNALLRQQAISQVVHLAASIDVRESVREPLRYYANNVEATRVLAEACINQGIRDFVFASTAAVYGDLDDDAISETAPCNPLSPYGRSKLLAEQVLQDAAHAHNFEPVILRFFNAAGADPNGRSGPSKENASDLMRLTCRSALGLSDGLTVFGSSFDTPDGTCIRDFVHVSDLARVQIAALDHLKAGGTSAVYNVGSGNAVSVADVVDAFRTLEGDFPVTYEAAREGEIVRSLSDSSKVQTALNWSPQDSDLKTMARHALDWERQL